MHAATNYSISLIEEKFRNINMGNKNQEFGGHGKFFLTDSLLKVALEMFLTKLQVYKYLGVLTFTTCYVDSQVMILFTISSTVW